MEQDFQKWFTDNIQKCSKGYDDVAPYFRRYVYKILKDKHHYKGPSKELDEIIDKAFKVRFGLSTDTPICNDRVVSEVIDSLIYGYNIPQSLIMKFVHSCRKYTDDKFFRHEMKKQLIINYNSRYDIL